MRGSYELKLGGQAVVLVLTIIIPNSGCLFYFLGIDHNCDWLWENPPLTHKNKYLETCNSIIQSVISQEG